MIRYTAALLALTVVAGALVAGCSDSSRGGAGGPGADPAAPPLEQQGYEWHVSGAGSRVSLPDQLARGSTVAYILSELDHTVPEGASKPWKDYAASHDIEIYLYPWHSYGKPSLGRHAVVFGESSRGRYLIASLGRVYSDDSGGPAAPSLNHEMAHEVRSIGDDCQRCLRNGNTWILRADGLQFPWAK